MKVEEEIQSSSNLCKVLFHGLAKISHEPNVKSLVETAIEEIRTLENAAEAPDPMIEEDGMRVRNLVDSLAIFSLALGDGLTTYEIDEAKGLTLLNRLKIEGDAIKESNNLRTLHNALTCHVKGQSIPRAVNLIVENMFRGVEGSDRPASDHFLLKRLINLVRDQPERIDLRELLRCTLGQFVRAVEYLSNIFPIDNVDAVVKDSKVLLSQLQSGSVENSCLICVEEGLGDTGTFSLSFSSQLYGTVEEFLNSLNVRIGNYRKALNPAESENLKIAINATPIVRKRRLVVDMQKLAEVVMNRSASAFKRFSDRPGRVLIDIDGVGDSIEILIQTDFLNLEDTEVQITNGDKYRWDKAKLDEFEVETSFVNGKLGLPCHRLIVPMGFKGRLQWD